MTQNRPATALLTACTLLLTFASAATMADSNERERSERSGDYVEVKDAARTASDVVVTEHAGVTQAEGATSIVDDMRLPPAEQSR